MLSRRNAPCGFFVHAIGQRTHAPVFRFHDLAAALLDDAGHLGGQFFDLLGARILTREKNMLIKRHGCPFLVLTRFPPASPSRPFGKEWDKLRRRKHGTTDRLALPHQDRRKGEIAETVRSAPGRDPRMARFIRILTAMARETGSAETGRFGRRVLGNPANRRLGLTYLAPAGVFRRNFSDIQRTFRERR